MTWLDSTWFAFFSRWHYTFEFTSHTTKVIRWNIHISFFFLSILCSLQFWIKNYSLTPRRDVYRDVINGYLINIRFACDSFSGTSIFVTTMGDVFWFKWAQMRANMKRARSKIRYRPLPNGLWNVRHLKRKVLMKAMTRNDVCESIPNSKTKKNRTEQKTRNEGEKKWKHKER